MPALRYSTRATVRAKVRRITHTENSYGNVSDAELNDVLDDGARRLYDLLTEGRGQEYYRKETNVTLVAGTNTYDLPADFFEPLLVYVYESTTTTGGLVPTTVGAGNVFELKPYEMHELVRLKNITASGGLSHVSQLRYRHTGQQGTASLDDLDQIEFWPTPTSTKIVTVAYLPKQELTSLSEEDGPAYLTPGSSVLWLEYFGAEYVFLKRREAEEAAWARSKMDEIAASIRARSEARDANEPVRMRGRKHSPTHLLDGDYAEDWP